MTENEAEEFCSTHELTEQLWEKLDDVPEDEPLPPRERNRTTKRR